MSAPPRLSSPRYRRRIIATGLIAAGALFSFVAPMYVQGIEDDLERRVPEELAEAGFGAVTAEFSGQDGTLSCARPLDDPEAALDAAYDVWGVRAITVDRSCRVNVATATADEQQGEGASGSATTSSDSDTDRTLPTEPAAVTSTAASTAAMMAASEADYATLADLVSGDRRFSYLKVLLGQSGMTSQFADPQAEPVTVFAPTDAAFDKLSADANARLRSDPALLERVLEHHVAPELLLVADLAPGSLGVLDGDSLRVALVGSAVTVDGARLIDTDLVAGNGVVHAIDTVLIPADVDLETPVTTTPATSAPATTITPPSTAPSAVPSAAPTAEQAAALTAELNEYVAANPIRFAVGQNVVSPESEVVLDHVAPRILELPGVTVTIEGHTDSDGSPQRNLELSQQRAQAVLLELVARGLTDVPLSAVGYGSERRVIVNGREDKQASRRVEFVVEVAP